MLDCSAINPETVLAALIRLLSMRDTRTVDRRTTTALTLLATLERQFEAGASQYHRLSHLLVEAPSDRRELLLGPFPVEGCRRPEQAIATSYPPSEVSFRIRETEQPEDRIRMLDGPRIYQFHAI